MNLPPHEYEWDIFVSHAHEDKEPVVRELVTALRSCGLRVWFDEDVLTIGDSLRRSIDAGLLKSRFGVVVLRTLRQNPRTEIKEPVIARSRRRRSNLARVENIRQRLLRCARNDPRPSARPWEFCPMILSPRFFVKEWPRKELDALVARDDGREKVILPIWHEISFEEVKRFSPLLADKLALLTSQGPHTIAKAIAALVFAEAGKHSRATFQEVRWGPVDGKPAGISVEGYDGQSFIAWNALRSEIEASIIPQMDYIPPGCTVALGSYADKPDWVVRVLEPGGTEVAHIWFGPDPSDDWAHDGLIRVGLPKDPAEVWHIFERYSDGSYRKRGTK